MSIFKESFLSLFKKGLPSFWEEVGILLSRVEYQALLVKCRLDHMKFEYMSQSLSGQTMIDNIVVDFEIINTFRAVCSQLPTISYVDHVELWVLAKEMANLELPTLD